MNTDLYRAAAKGEIEPFIEIAEDELVSIVTHHRNTVLHVNIASQRGARVSNGVRATDTRNVSIIATPS